MTQRKRQITIRAQITLGFLVTLALLLGLGYSTRRAVSKIGRDLDTAVNTTARRMELAGELRTGFQDMKAYAARTQFAFVMTRLARPNAAAGAVSECSMCHAQDTREASERGLRAIAAKVVSTVSKLQPLTTSEKGTLALRTVRKGVDEYTSMFGEYSDLVDRNRYDEAHDVLRTRMFPLVDGIDKILDQLSEEERTALKLSDRQARETVSGSQWVTLLLIGVSLVVIFAVLVLLRRRTSGLQRMAAELRQGAEGLASAASQMSSSSESLARGSSQQAAAIEETSASSEEIGSMARKNSENSHSAAVLVTRSELKFAETNRSLDHMVAAMNEINASSDKISKIIKVIDEIAFQTNILALNAAVEAARAGQAGMGFAVVADEVRNLAQRCARAAEETAALIEESMAKSNEGKTKVDRVAAAIRAVTEEVARVRTLVAELNLGSEEQARGIEQIGKAISEMEHVTQKNAANAEESASAAEELTAQSETLREVAERLTAVVGSSKTALHR